MRLIYLAGPYNDKDEQVRRQRMECYMDAVTYFMESAPSLCLFSPVIHNATIASHHEAFRVFNIWAQRDFFMIKKSSAVWVLTLPGWEKSYGVGQEIEYAESIDREVFYVTREGQDYIVYIDAEKKRSLRSELGTVITRLEEYINYLLGHPLNSRSPKQLATLFYNDFGIKPVTIYDKTTGKRRRTCNADALDTIAKREVLVAPICAAVNSVRSLGTFKSVCSKELDIGDRMRCSYQVPGTETYRYNSSEDAFGYGTNLQNISEGDEDQDKDSHLYRPNLKKMFIPDPGCAIADHDLAQADARIVAWESNCLSLKEIFNDPTRDLHNENCEIIFGSFKGNEDPNRQRAKVGVHAAHYAGTAAVIARALGITIHEAEAFLSRYFGERPEVLKWHKAIRIQLQTKRYVENVFGFRRLYFDRIEDLLKAALAWIPQSTVAIAINLGIKKVEQELPWAEFLLQVHDSAVHQFPIGKDDEYQIEDSFELIRKTMEIVLPYDDPMTIPVTGKWSLESWGDCK